MPKESRRTKINRIVCRRTKLDRRICPFCGVEVTEWNRNKVQRCFSCRKHFVWHSAQKVLTSRVRGKATLRYSGRGSPAMSTIEERSEAGDDRPRPSSGSSPIDDDGGDDEHTPDHDSLDWWTTAGRQGDRSVDGDGNGNAAAAFASLATDREDGTVVGEAFVDLEPARNTGSTQTEDWRCSLSIWEIINKNNAASLYTTTVSVVGLNQQSTTALLPATAVPELVPDAPCPTSPHPTPSRTTSPCPSFPHPMLKKKKRCSFGEKFRRKRAEPMEPRPSLEDTISIPEVVPRQHAAELLNTLTLARYTHSRGISTDPTTASPAIVPQEPDGILQQHAADLHDALARLEALKVARDSEEASVSSGRRRSFWSQLACFL